jgi:hypothetical protein
MKSYVRVRKTGKYKGIADWIYDKDDIYINWFVEEATGEQMFQVVPNSAFETSLFPVEKGQTDKIRLYVYRGYMRMYEAKTRARYIDLIEIDTSTVPNDFSEYMYYYVDGKFVPSSDEDREMWIN